jgi:hypothetical protein
MIRQKIIPEENLTQSDEKNYLMSGNRLGKIPSRNE